MIRFEMRIVGYSKNAPFRGGVGYVLYEVGGDHWKEPMSDFLMIVLK